jgi:hypothetical protein
MFDWFKKPEYSNVVPFPKSEAPIFPDQVPYEPEKNTVTYYTIGHTDDNRVAMRMGHTTLTMTYQGVQNLIDQLELYQNQLNKDDQCQDEE